MRRQLLLAVLSLLLFSGLAHADVLRPKVHFNINVPYTVKIGKEKAGQVIIPCGEYTIRDLGLTSPNLTLSLSKRGTFDPIAIISTVRIDSRAKWVDSPKLVFDEENGTLVMTRIYVPGEDPFDIISAVTKKKVSGPDCPMPAKAVITSNTVQQRVTETKPVEPAAEPVREPEPAPAPKVEPTPEPEPAPVAPVKERKRVRKN